jgi:hypothetical protein
MAVMRMLPAMRVPVPRAMRMIGASLGLKWRFFDFQGKPQSPHHVIEHMVVAIPQPQGSNLQCNVPIA